MTVFGVFVRLFSHNNFTSKYLRKFGTSTKRASPKCLHDITSAARQNKLSPVIGRDSEIRRCIDILCRRTKNNVILLGEPGVGKTAVVEALAHRIVKGNVPEALADCRILSIDMGCLFAKSPDDNSSIDTKLRNIICDARAFNCILFIDEAHLMVSKSYDWASALKPELANGDIKCIAATTNAEYRRYFVRDKALQRRFQPMYIGEPTQSSTIEILKSLKSCYESFHRVIISDEAIVSAVRLSSRYIKDRFDPDKSIDLLDEACSIVKNRSQLIPESMEVLQNRMRSLRLQGNEHEMESLSYEIQEIESEWREGKIKYEELSLLIKSFYESRREESEALKSGNLENVGMLRFDRIPKLESQLFKFVESNVKYRNYFIVEPIDVANVVSKWTRIPTSSISTSHMDLLNALKSKLISAFSNHSGEIDKLISALYVSSMSDNSIAAIGISGDNEMDKHEIISIITQALSSSSLSIDLSEFGERHSLSKAVGPPPGYVGYEFGGQLTELIKNGAATCITLYNIKKCHPTVKELLCSSIQKGYIKDSRGEVISLSNTCIIFSVRHTGELSDFNAVINEVIEISGRTSTCTIGKAIDAYCKKVENHSGIAVKVDGAVVDYIAETDSHLLLARLKKFISRAILGPGSAHSAAVGEFVVGVSGDEYTIVSPA